MSTPEQLRADAHELRQVAATIKQKAAALDDDVVAVTAHYPEGHGGVWEGPSATEFYDKLGTVRTNLGTLATDVSGYAADCLRKAGQLEDDADDLEEEQQKKKKKAAGG